MSPQGIAVLVATRNRPGLLRERAIPSIRQQQRRADCVVIVNDGADLPDDLRAQIRSLPSREPPVVLPNRRTPGAAGAWNTGLDWLRSQGFAGFVAMLDDDDTWDAQHLRLNHEVAHTAGADLSVSGLRLHVAGRVCPRPLIDRLEPRDFLVSNPGWQGSNTFVRLAALADVGDFDEQLPSTHDRDLAVRLLRRPGTSTVLVPEWTATWYFGTPGGLSVRGGQQKLDGLRQFLAKHGTLMSESDRTTYFERAERVFGFPRAEIECTAP